jgi:hypothetical protein
MGIEAGSARRLGRGVVGCGWVARDYGVPGIVASGIGLVAGRQAVDEGAAVWRDEVVERDGRAVRGVDDVGHAGRLLAGGIRPPMRYRGVTPDSPTRAGWAGCRHSCTRAPRA